MNKQEAEENNISIYWWNFGKKTLDFRGSYKEYLKKLNVKINNITFPTDKKIKGLKFKFPLNTMTFTIESFDTDVTNSFNMVIKTYLTYLGDKTIFNDCYGREYKINWK